MSASLLRIGCGAGFSGDRWDAAVPVVKTLRAAGGPAVLMFETLAERTLALAQLRRRQAPDAGWEPSLERFVSPVLRDCVEAGIAIVGNFGAANPAGAARRIQQLAASLGLPPLKVAVVEGDDLLASLSSTRMDELLPASLRGKPLVSANAQRVPRRQRDRRGFACGRAGRGHRPCGRSRARARADARALRLEAR
jgi:hypothetical protein